jgi:hypothetical protein
MPEWITYLQELLQTPVAIGALGGALSAARTDYDAFRTWDEWSDVAGYSWKLAAFRWFQGAVVGVVTALGITAVL